MPLPHQRRITKKFMIMEQKINIAQLLKDCPSGMELDCTLFEGLEFDSIVDNEFLPIRCRVKNPIGGYNGYNFTKYGCWLNTTFAKCVIFPKGKTTWKGFVPPCKFKVGNAIQNEDGYKVKITEVNVADECCEYESVIAKGIGSIAFSEQDEWELVSNKFDITTLKPFDKVLYRMHRNDTWLAGFYNVCIKNKIFVIGLGAIPCCIPYKSNEHLLGTTDDCDEFYKNW